MKKLICTILCIGMVTGLFTGCGSEPKNEDVKEPAENDAQSDEKDDVEDGSQSGEPEGAKAGSDDAMKIAYLVDVLGESQMSYVDYMQEYCDYLNETEAWALNLPILTASLILQSRSNNWKIVFSLAMMGSLSGR